MAPLETRKAPIGSLALSAVAINMIVFPIAILLTREVAPSTGAGVRAARHPLDLPVRALAVGALVASVVTLSSVLGPAVTGIAAVFPIAITSLALTVQPRLGGAIAASTMAAALRTMPGMGFGFLTVHLLAPRFGSALGLGAGLVVSLIWPLVLIVARRARLAS